MTMQSLHFYMNFALIVTGAIILLISYSGAKELRKSLELIPGRQQKFVGKYLALHRSLMMFFFLGYLVVLTAFAFKYDFIGETLVSIIFFFGAVFVFIGINVQSRLMAEVRITLHGILPICCRCKKIRNPGANPHEPSEWEHIETFISRKTHVDFSHGYCPACLSEELREFEETSALATRPEYLSDHDQAREAARSAGII